MITVYQNIFINRWALNAISDKSSFRFHHKGLFSFFHMLQLWQLDFMAKNFSFALLYFDLFIIIICSLSYSQQSSIFISEFSFR